MVQFGKSPMDSSCSGTLGGTGERLRDLAVLVLLDCWRYGEDVAPCIQLEKSPIDSSCSATLDLHPLLPLVPLWSAPFPAAAGTYRVSPNTRASLPGASGARYLLLL